MIVGFTGTAHGMSHQQLASIQGLLLKLDSARNSNPKECGPVTEVHHGDCIGADAEFHDIVRRVLPNAKIIIHPPTKVDKRAFKEGDESLEPKPYLDRNLDIVNAADILVAASFYGYPVRRSGTWHTIRYAIRKNITVDAFGPDGGYINHREKDTF